MTDERVLIVADNGLSGSKIFWNEPGEPLHLMQLPPEIRQVKAENIFDSGLASGKPQDNALIELADGRLFAVGKQARDLRGKSPVEETKYQMSVYKLLATVGAIAATLGVTKLSVTLATLLPYSEYQDRQQFIELLKRHLKEFKFRGTLLRVTAESVIIKPEGAGLAITHMNQTDTFNSQNTVVFMVGHRDASLLPFEQGSPNNGLGEELGDQLGFLEFQKQVAKRASLNLKAKDQAKLPEYLFKARTQPQYIRLIAEMVVSGSEIDGKVGQLKEHIESSHGWYIETLTQWVESTLGSFLYEVNHVLIAGGAAFYSQAELTAFFRSFPNLQDSEAISWGGLELKADIEALIGEAVTTELAVRLADAWGLYNNTIMRFPDLTPDTNPETESDLGDLGLIDHHEPAFDETMTADDLEREIATAEPKQTSNSKGRATKADKPELPSLPKTNSRRG